jgi:threonine 3-dehydrogenase
VVLNPSRSVHALRDEGTEDVRIFRLRQGDVLAVPDPFQQGVNMKALVKTRPERGAELRDLQVPSVGPGQVLVKVKATAICGTDVHIYEWNAYAQQRIKLPMVFGHEFCGEVVRVGEQVRHLKPGDLIAGETHIPCGDCFQCQTGNQHVCEGMTILGVHTAGVFSEFAVIPAVCAWKLPAGTDPELGAVLEPMGVAAHGLLVEPVDGGSVAIIGCGPIGIFAAQIAAAMGAHPLFVIDVNPDRLAMAQRIVPQAVGLNPAKDGPLEVVRKATGRGGVDIAVELSGSVPGTRLAFDLVRVGGRVSLVGLTGEPVILNTVNDIIYKEVTVKGTTGRLMWKTWHQLDRLLASGRLDPRPVITHRFPLTEYAQAFDLARSGKAGKIILLP